MSAPLVVTTKDGTTWTHRGSLRDGRALYAPADVCTCPQYVMATEAELAEHGIAGVAYALPMPVAESVSEGLSPERLAEITARRAEAMTVSALAGWPLAEYKLIQRTHQDTAVLLAEIDRLRVQRDAFCDRVDTLTSVAAGNKRHVISMAAECQRLADRVAELEQERHSTNKALDDAVQELRANGGAFVPRTERSYWVGIADALNAAHAAGMPVGVDLDGTLTDHRMWSVVWDRAAERWVVAGYDDEPDGITQAIAPTQALQAETGGAS